MKKRLSLLLATLMVITMLPMSAFATAAPKVVVQDVTTSDQNKDVLVAFEFEKTSVATHLATQKLRLELTNGAKFQKTGGNFENITLSASGLTGNADLSPGDGAAALTQMPDDATTAFLTIGHETAGQFLEITNAANPGVLKLAFKVDFTGAKEGDVALRVVDTSTLANLQTSIGNQSVKFAVVKDVDQSDLAVTVKDSEKAVSFDGGELSQFEITNLAKLTDPDAAGPKTRRLSMKIVDDKATFAGGGGTLFYVDGTKNTPGAAATIVLAQPNNVAPPKSIIVKPEATTFGRKASEGPVDIELILEEVNGATVTQITRKVVRVGKTVDYNVTMTVVEKNKKEIPAVWGGEEATVVVTLKGPKGSFNAGRDINFVVDGAQVKYTVNPKTAGITQTGDNKDGFYKDNEFELQGATATTDEVKFEMDIVTKADKDGVATIKASQRGGWEAKADLAKVTPKFSAKVEEMPVKKGEEREVSNIVITEAKAGLLERGQKITLEFDTRRDYTAFTKAGVKVEATNGMTFGEPAFAKDANDKDIVTKIEIPIKKYSNGEPAVITISGVKVLVDGSATDDTVKIKLGINGKKVTDPTYIKVVKEYALESIKTVFTIGQTQYDVNGKAKASAAAPYIKNGKTMLPIRALAESLGLTVQWNGATKTATFSDATKVAAVTIGAEKMYVNGTPVPLAAKAELVSGTTFVELRSLATAFGVQIDWDAAAKTATVSK